MLDWATKALNIVQRIKEKTEKDEYLENISVTYIAKFESDFIDFFLDILLNHTAMAIDFYQGGVQTFAPIHQSLVEFKHRGFLYPESYKQAFILRLARQLLVLFMFAVSCLFSLSLAVIRRECLRDSIRRRRPDTIHR